ncbi:glycoside hydrolase family 74 protein [Moniliophthora roreri MCA 2997]|uniref:Glycoside hydrolase family 74 protein n=1 Tax=Moniliophthora roreri (strain MCA 2997) TaxID=1381753 RepID=V2YMH7_MONRO|nr:glycoside hydrolase family 74 protein [Moniliophthora roreri MCA 2997]
MQAVLSVLGFLAAPLVQAVDSQAYNWKNLKIGGGGGISSSIRVSRMRERILVVLTGYRLNADDLWTPLLDWAIVVQSDYWGVAALATDPVEPNGLYMAVGLYINYWDPNPGHILISDNYGSSFTEVQLPFKIGGNMPGRGMGERLAIDPDNNILFFGVRSGNGLWKSSDKDKTWSKVSSLPNTGTPFLTHRIVRDTTVTRSV